MKILFNEIYVRSHELFELIDITSEIEKIVSKSGVRNGFCIIFVPHATASLIVNEHEPGLLNDIINKLKELYPPNEKYQHNRIDDNAHAHIASSIIGSERIFPIKDGQIIRGTWQNILLVELDGPRSQRKIIVEIVGE
ncbi:MAG: secondary thiamine-phosphate synthase enzyme YjbQ [Thermoprotei archaeon]